MLLLLTTLALAQDPAPEGEAETSSSAETAPAQVPEESEGWSGEIGEEAESTEEALEAVEAVEEPVAVDPSLWGTYEEGYEAGRVAAEELADWVQPAVAGAGIGAGAAGIGIVCGGVVCGGPAVLGGAGYQAYKTRKDVPPPPPGAWQKRSAEFQTGFIQGFQARANQKRTRWALAGGTTGAVVGAGVGLVVVAVLYDRQGRDFL